MMDDTFGYLLTFAALVGGILLLTGHGGALMKGGNTQERAKKYKKDGKSFRNLPASYWNRNSY